MTGQRRALLIGVSEFGKGYAPLPGAMRDLDEISRVLDDPNMGSFQIADTLRNPDAANIGSALRQFLNAGQTDDTLLVYFTGHGAKGQFDYQLYLAGSNTRKLNGELDEASAFSSGLLRQYLMDKRACRSGCVIVILDCCFSGAVGNWLKKGDDFLEGFRAEGKVIMAACSAAESAYQPTEADLPNQPPLSIYTRYFTQGIEQGTAQQSKQDWITAQDLHHYISRSIQTESPAEMHPKLIALDDGAFARIARAPKGDPIVRYRQWVNALLQDTNGELDPDLELPTCEEERQKLGLTADLARQIEHQEQTPFRILAEKRQKYRQHLTNLVQQGRDLTQPRVQTAIQRYQQSLSLDPDDIHQIEQVVTAHTPPQPKPTPAPPQNPHSAPPDLRSEKGVDYSHLRDLLAKAAQTNSANAWKAADQETYAVMCKVLGKDWKLWNKIELLNYPRADLLTMDRLWVYYSNEHFGFSVQKEIYVKSGARPDGEYPKDKSWYTFFSSVGWRVNDSYIFYSEVTFSTSSPRGHLPVVFKGGQFEVCGEVDWMLGFAVVPLLSHRDL